MDTTLQQELDRAHARGLIDAMDEAMEDATARGNEAAAATSIEGIAAVLVPLLRAIAERRGPDGTL
jgi:hypothetical protein